MIGKVSRGWHAGGLLRYLLGPGRFNEHTDPHVVATWDDRPEAWQPPRTTDGSLDVRKLAAALTAVQLAAGLPRSKPSSGPGGKVPQGPVWHCSLRNHAVDRVLSDAEWAAIARDVLDRTGIAPYGDPYGCRWVLVRHAADHVHLAAVLVRQDSARRVHPKFDHRKIGQVARETEARLGLTPTAASDRTAPRHATRGEQEKARREAIRLGPERDVAHGRPVRVVLREAARQAALHARSPEEFVERVASVVVRVRVHRDAAGQIDGYALALVGDRDAAGHLVWFSGSRLARDLSMPRLVAVWASADVPPPPIPSQPGERFRPGRAEYFGALDQATRAVHDATDAVREDRTTASPHDDGRGSSAAADGIAYSLRDLLDLTGDGTRYTYPELGDAARLYDRAARTPHTVLPNRWSDEARRLRTATWRLAAIGALPGRGAARAPLAALVAAIATLVAEIAAYQATKQRLAQAQAARRCAIALTSALRAQRSSADGAETPVRRRSPTLPPTHRTRPPEPVPPRRPTSQAGPWQPGSPDPGWRRPPSSGRSR